MPTEIVTVDPKGMSRKKYRFYMLATMMQEFKDWVPEMDYPDIHFDMNIFFDRDAYIQKTHSWENFCGTAACALGSAAIHPWFQKEGLSVGGFCGVKFLHKEQVFEGYDAAAKFFGLTDQASEALFTEDEFSVYYKTDIDFDKPIANYPAASTPAAMARRLYRFLDKHYDIQHTLTFDDSLDF